MLDKIKSILSQYSGIDPEQISAESNLKADLELNSLDLVEIVIGAPIKLMRILLLDSYKRRRFCAIHLIM